MAEQHPREFLLAALHGEVGPNHTAQLREHLSACAECREEQQALRQADELLAVALRPAAVPAFAERVVARARVAPAAPGMTASWKWLNAAAAIVLLTAAGFGIYRFATRPQAPPADANQMYILLLYQNVAELKSLPPDQARARGQEYIDWASRLREQGRYVSAARLRDTPGTIVAPGGEALPGPPIQGDMSLTGYYIIRARDEAEATAIAQAGPHSKYGTIVIRRVR